VTDGEDALALTSGTNDIVLVDNDFSSSDLSQYKLKGNWRVVGGMLRTLGTGGSAYLVYEIPEEYEGMSYQIDVDFFAHTSTGGILIGAEGSGIAKTPTAFSGFDAFLGPDGTQAALGCYNAQGGWGGNVAVSDYSVVPKGDVHLRVRVVGDNITYTVTSLDGETEYFGISYDLGTGATAATDDIYSNYGRKVGLRKFHNDQGAFDNFKVKIFVDDVLPEMTESITLGGIGFASKGLALEGDKVSGNGAMLSKDKLDADFTASLMLKPEGVSKLLFGMKDEKNGYSFEIDKDEETVALYQITDGRYECLGTKNVPVGDGTYLATVSVDKKVAKVLFDSLSQGSDAFYTFELGVSKYRAGSFGIWLEGGEASALSVAAVPEGSGETYVNPVNPGADPALIYHEGTYYLYHRIQAGNDIFRVYTSANLVDWVERDAVFTHKPEKYKNLVSGYMSPIPFYYDGVFYLFFTGKTPAGDARIYCASSDSPYGPFEYKDGEKPLHNVKEIYGYPFLDDDGKLYMIYNRFDNGNHVYIEQITLEDGTFSAVRGTLRKIMSPITEYENDGYGFVSEGGVIYKHNGYYYLVWSAGHYMGHYGLAYAVSENVLGPYTRYEYNEVLTYNSAADGVGYGVFIPSPDGTELCILYHRHAEVGKVSPRRTCVDRAAFVKDLNGGPDILTFSGPTSTAQPLPSNRYRYDINRDGRITVGDALILQLRQSIDGLRYRGDCDVDANGKENSRDIKAVFERIGLPAWVQ
ncbi:MAG: family 43 glycosylhydrolase, partial [Clostridia bacterium]|nr:family 43 glycosylhydrolase [Clostridia bacterium]